MKKIEIHIDKIYDEDVEITDIVEIAKMIKGHISHLGSFSIYVEPKPKTFLHKFIFQNIIKI